jgi:murein DD-endopeptidase MepM/ murein hydrolase activator NlpD
LVVNPPHPSDFPAQADPEFGASYSTHDASAHAYAPYEGYDQSASYGYDTTGAWYPEAEQHAPAGAQTTYGTAQWSEWDANAYATQASTSWGTGSYEAAYDTTAYPAVDHHAGADYTGADYATATGYEAYQAAEPEPATQLMPEAARAPEPAPEPEPTPTPVRVAEPMPRHLAARGRRRSPRPHRSALLTVAAPSVAVLGVAGVAAASVGGVDATTTQASAPDPAAVKSVPSNTKLDTQLAGLSHGAGDFADRASRTQERIDLKKRQEAERKRKAAEAARREAMRPKFVLPVHKGSGISAYFGQAGVNWMSVHTGIDFPVSYGTPVHAATDGTITTKWNNAYGNMAIITAADGTETWYCHLSSTRIRSGHVKAGDLIAYSGSSGNSTGPHLHFEVHPQGGPASDPIPWFHAHGLQPG